MLEQSILMILKLFLNTQMIWMIFLKTLKNITQNINCFDYMIADILSNKKLTPIPSRHATSRGNPLKVS